MKAMRAAELRRAAGHFATGVTVVTTRDGKGEFYGLTMNAITALSLEPPLFLICVDNTSDTLPALSESGVFAINVLAHDQEVISRVFATKDKDKFVGIGHHVGETGAPLIDDTLAAIECQVTETYPGGDHVVVLGQVERIEVNDKGEPLLFYRGRYAELLT